ALTSLLGERRLSRIRRCCHRQLRRPEFPCANHRGVGGVPPPLGTIGGLPNCPRTILGAAPTPRATSSFLVAPARPTVCAVIIAAPTIRSNNPHRCNMDAGTPGFRK